jgi:hypothetical protein
MYFWNFLFLLSLFEVSIESMSSYRRIPYRPFGSEGKHEIYFFFFKNQQHVQLTVFNTKMNFKMVHLKRNNCYANPPNIQTTELFL